MSPEDIDRTETILFDLLEVGATFYPPLAVVLPVVQAFVRYEGTKLKAGLADGTIVADGRGGFVPKSNSHYDPKTGEFL